MTLPVILIFSPKLQVLKGKTGAEDLELAARAASYDSILSSNNEQNKTPRNRSSDLFDYSSKVLPILSKQIVSTYPS
jgi:hypothetical protein